MRKNREFAKVLKRLRTEKGISQENLSLEANLARTYISLLERELRSPSLKTINKICEVLEILPSNFMELVEQEKNKGLNEELSQNSAEEIKPQLLYSHLIDIIGNTLNLIVIDEHFKIVYANQNICDLLDYDKNKLLNSSIDEISDPGSVLNIKNLYQGLFTRERYAYTDIICKNRNSENIHFNTAIIPHSPEAKTALLVLIDATEYKKTQDELLKSQSYLGMALSATKQIIWQVDVKNNTINILSRNDNHIGYFPREDVHSFSSVTKERIHPHDLQKILLFIESTPKHDEPYFEFEYRSKRNSKEYRWNLARCKVIKWNSDDRPHVIIGTSFDIDEKKKAQMALALNESRLESLVKLNQLIDSPSNDLIEYAINEMVDLTESETGLIIMIDKQDHFHIHTNNPELKNLNPKDILNKVLPTIYHDKILKVQEILTLNQIDKNLFSTSHNVSKLLCTPIKDHSEVVIISLVTNKIEDYNNADARQLTLLMQGLWRILEYKRLNEQKKQVEKNLSISSRLASMNVLCRCIAHEINNPLSMIQGYSDDLKDALTNQPKMDPKNIYQATEQIDNMVDRIASVIKGMRTFIQDSTMGFVKNIKINELLDNTLHFVKTKLTNVDVELKLINRLPSNQIIDCHPSQIAETLLNLIYNSIDAIYKRPERWICLEVDLKDRNIHISITDSGKGIGPEITKHLFDPFFTTKEDYKGQGLGLYISKTFIEDHHGSLKYDSSSKNTCFRLVLPVSQQ